MAVSSRAMRSVPVTSRKMMKMLMILSKDRSNHTTICIETEENEDGALRTRQTELRNTREKVALRHIEKTASLP